MDNPYPEGKPRRLTIDALEPHHCRYITRTADATRPAYYCGAPKQTPRSSYCAAHHAVCWYTVGKGQRRPLDPNAPVKKRATHLSAFKLRERT
jgi:hypothetical protein